jgi:hypothetical protein
MPKLMVASFRVKVFDFITCLTMAIGIVCLSTFNKFGIGMLVHHDVRTREHVKSSGKFVRSEHAMAHTKRLNSFRYR